MKHVDFSGEYFLIFLTEDNQLYGLGGNPAGILKAESRQEFNSTFMNVILEPVLLMENVAFAKCRYTTLIAMLENGDVYVMGNNRFGQCGNGTFSDMVEEPQMVMKHVLCAWMGRVSFNGGNVIPERDNLVVLGIDGQYYGCGEGIGNDFVQDTSDDFDMGHMDEVAKIKTSNVLQNIEVDEYENSYGDE